MSAPEETQAALQIIVQLAQEYGPALDTAFRILRDGALTGSGAIALYNGMIERHVVVRQSFAHAFQQVERLRSSSGHPMLHISVPVITAAPSSPPTASRAGFVGGAPKLLNALSQRLGKPGRDWEESGAALATVMSRLGLNPAPGHDIGRAGAWITAQTSDLNRRRDELLKKPPQTSITGAVALGTRAKGTALEKGGDFHDPSGYFGGSDFGESTHVGEGTAEPALMPPPRRHPSYVDSAIAEMSGMLDWLAWTLARPFTGDTEDQFSDRKKSWGMQSGAELDPGAYWSGWEQAEEPIVPVGAGLKFPGFKIFGAAKPEVLFRGDGRAVYNIFEKGMTARDPSMSLAEHLAGGNGLRATSRSKGMARGFAVQHKGYIYEIDNIGNGTVVTYGKGYRHLMGEQEVVFTHLDPSQIRGAWRIGKYGAPDT